MKALSLLIASLPIALPAAELAPATAQYAMEEGAVAAPAELPPAELPPAEPPEPRVLPRTVWPKIELADGRVLERARANAEDAASVTFLHSGGITKVDKRLLPAALAEVFAYDAAAATAEARRRAEALSQRRLAALAAQAERARSADVYRPAPVAYRSGVGESAVPARPDTSAVIEAVRSRATDYFENQKRTGSGQTLVFGVRCEIDEPVALTGWANRWEVAGKASYKVYDSVNWGSFSTRSGKRFRAFVEMPPGGRAKVIDFEER